MTQTTTQGWDHTTDVLVVGSGAGGMTTAFTTSLLGGEALLIEKSDRYGGSSAMSGGTLWIPNNYLMAETGVTDSPDDALAYLKETTQGQVPEERLRTYIEKAPEMLRTLRRESRLELQPLEDYPDYYPAASGSKPGARTIETQHYHARELGDEFARLREPHVQTLIMGRMAMTAREARVLLCRSPGWIRLTARIMARYWLVPAWRLRSKRDRNLTMGNALVGRLRRSLMDRDVPLWLSTAAEELIVEDRRVVGLVARQNGHRLRLRARRGVVLASGGFESNTQLRQKYLPNPSQAEWTLGSPSNTGDSIGLGEAVGAAFEFMDDAWWGPVTVVPGEDRARMLVIEKSLPGSILVNQAGARFVNEAAPYIDVVNAMYRKDTPESSSVPAFLIFDAKYRKRYPCGPFLQSAQQPDWTLPKSLRQGYLKKARSLEELAGQLGIEPTGLRATVARLNEYARTGIDLDFHRGETVFDRYYGDEKVLPNPCLAPLDKPPYYGLEAYPGDLGTKGGLKTNAAARVLREDGSEIEGLYATGNCSASVMGPTYPGAGSTLGPAMTFGYIAARDAMGV